MRTDLKEVLKSIPDFEEFLELTDQIKETLLKKLILEKEIRTKESSIVKEATYNPKYFINGKPPSAAFIESTYKYTGFENELLSLREELLKSISELEGFKLRLDVYKNLVDIWRTLSSNERNSSM